MSYMYVWVKSQLQRRLIIKKDKELPTKRVEDLREMLGFDLPPLIIDTFDVSTLMGRNNVGSCVRFVNGKPQAIESVYIMKNPETWDRFMRFMERYGESNGLVFTKAR